MSVRFEPFRACLPPARAFRLPTCPLLLALALACGDASGGPGGTSPSSPADALPDGAARIETPAKLEAYQAALKERAEVRDPRACGVGKRMPDLAFETIDGLKSTLAAYADGHPLVLVARDVFCPVSMRIGPRTVRIEKEYTAKGVKWLYVNPCSHNELSDIREEIETYGFGAPYVHDPETVFVHALDLERTTEFLVLDGALTLHYRGAVDDQIGRGVNSLPVAEHEYLEDALDAILAGKEPAIRATRAPGCNLTREELDPLRLEGFGSATAPTYHREVARILQANCLECHHEGGVAPIRLDSYKRVRGNRGQIRAVVENSIMPPWFAAPDTGPWANDRRLSDEDKGTLLAWIEAGAPQGDPAEAPVAKSWTEGWQIGEPDHVYRLRAPFPIPAEGTIDLQELYADRLVDEDLWVTAMQILPGDPAVVHHVVVLIQEPLSGRDTPTVVREALAPWQKRRGGWEFLGGYLPGKEPRVYPEGAARFVPKGSRIRFVLHYTAKGVATEDRTQLGFVTVDEVPDMVAQSYVMKNEDIFIPANAKDVAFQDKWRLPKDARLIALTPHMHLRGSRFFVDLTLPGQPQERLLELLSWDDAWQFSYMLAEPLDLPRGSELTVTGVYDNTRDNVLLPDGYYETSVANGPQVWDEMLMLAVEWIAPKESIRRLQ